MTELSIASRYADSDCAECEGTGMISIEDENVYCYCVKENMAEEKADNQE